MEKYDTTLITRYVRDASGNVMGIYNDTTVMELPIYGSSRAGVYRGEVLEGDQKLGRRSYELSNHLGNVLSVITDNIVEALGGKFNIKMITGGTAENPQEDGLFYQLDLLYLKLWTMDLEVFLPTLLAVLLKEVVILRHG